MHRTIIVARMRSDAQVAVAEIFQESDATSLPHQIGVQHRSLYSLGDIYLHVVEFRDDAEATLRRSRELPGFQQISQKLSAFIKPYDERNWRSPQDAVAREFYRWSATN
jgi:cyclase